MDLELIFLGTGSAKPTKTRGASCVMFKHVGNLWMFDCGEGSQIQATKIKSVKPSRLQKVFITHLHGDHLFGLPGFMNTFSQGSTEGEERVLEIYGPQGLRIYLRTCLFLSKSDLQCRYIVHELVPLAQQYPSNWKDVTITCETNHPKEVSGGRQIHADENETWSLFADDQFTVKAGWIKHRIPSFGFVIQEKDLPGRLDPKLLKAKGIKPGPDYARIKDGETITAPSGELIRPEDVVGPSRTGRKICILGDSCDSSAMTSLCKDCDVIVHETTLENELWESCIDKGHSTPEMAANFAKSVQAKQLVINHFSQRYKSPGEELEEGEECIEKLLHQSKAVFGDDVIAADDLVSVTIPVKKS